jgi:hypothetical protein
MSNEITGYVFEPEDYRALCTIRDRLFGDGTHMTTDQRRDLANWMHNVIGNAFEVRDANRQVSDIDKLVARINTHFDRIETTLTEMIKIRETGG